MCRIRFIECIAFVGLTFGLATAGVEDYRVATADVPNYLRYQATIDIAQRVAIRHSNAERYHQVEALRDEVSAPRFSYYR